MSPFESDLDLCVRNIVNIDYEMLSELLELGLQNQIQFECNLYGLGESIGSDLELIVYAL